MTTSIERARADLEAGRAWKARDRLEGALADRQDHELLDLLAEVHLEMGDLPAAGALWFVTGRGDDAARRCVAAWQERHGSDEARWQSLPGSVRRNVRSTHLSSLQGAARAGVDRRVRWHAGQHLYRETTWDRVEPFVWVLVVLSAFALMGVGGFTVLRWVVG